MVEDGRQPPAGQATRRPRWARPRPWLAPVLVLLVAAGGLGGLALAGRPIALPVWLVAEAEHRLNRALEPAMSLSLGGAEVMLGADWVPRLRLEDLRLIQQGGRTLLSLPEARITFDGAALLQGALRPQSVTLSGPRLALRRLADGRFDLALGPEATRIASYAELREATDRLFAQPLLADLARVEAEAMSLTLDDRRSDRVWQLGDGRFTLDATPERRALELGLSLHGAPDQPPAQALLTFVMTPGSPEARISATVDHVAAADVAAQALPIGWLEVLDAALSGRFAAALDGEGRLTRLEAELDSENGALRPTPEARPIRYDRAGLAFAYDPAAERINLTRLEVRGPSLRLTAGGHADLPGVTSGLPQALLAQIRFEDVAADPESLFEQPVHFSEGALDLRMRLDPFRVDIGQLALVEGGRRLEGRGQVSADARGWRVAFDMALNEISHRDLLALWPVSLVPKTRQWVAENVQEGQVFAVKGGLRIAPGAEPHLSLGYEFRGGDVRFLKTLPPIEKGSGYAVIEDRRYLMVLEEGQVTPPEGGAIRVTHGIFDVPDVTQKPAEADITIDTDSGVVAALSLLDQPPFSFLEKAGRPVDLAEGHALVHTEIHVPLTPKLPLDQVAFQVRGRIEDVVSDRLVPGRRITAPWLSLTADRAGGLAVSGAGWIGQVPFDVTYRLGFGPEDRDRSRVEGQVTLSPATVEEFRLGLPEGSVTGSGTGQVRIEIVKDQPPKLVLSSDLVGLGLGLPAIGWSKPAGQSGRLEVAATLGKPVSVERLVLEGGGLAATGSVALTAEGELDAVRLDRVRLNGWLDAGLTLAGRGKGRLPEVQLRGGQVDLRGLDLGRGGGGARGPGGEAVSIQGGLDRVQVTPEIALTGMEGRFSTGGGFNGSFRGRINGRAPVEGTVAPMAGRSAVHLRSEDAGGVLAAAGIFRDLRGGALDLRLTPSGARDYLGRAAISNFRLVNAPVLAALLNAISVVGLIEQLNGPGLAFSDGDAEFRVTPNAVEITRASAVGASMGVSLAGIYRFSDKLIDMQGVISPVYLLNGIGAVLTRKGEGLFGFNYSVSGTADRPSVSVNPLSILTPGMFRDLFRRPAPVLR